MLLIVIVLMICAEDDVRSKDEEHEQEFRNNI